MSKYVINRVNQIIGIAVTDALENLERLHIRPVIIRLDNQTTRYYEDILRETSTRTVSLAGFLESYIWIELSKYFKVKPHVQGQPGWDFEVYFGGKWNKIELKTSTKSELEIDGFTGSAGGSRKHKADCILLVHYVIKRSKIINGGIYFSTCFKKMKATKKFYNASCDKSTDSRKANYGSIKVPIVDAKYLVAIRGDIRTTSNGRNNVMAYCRFTSEQF
jgi:hypothetical protein